jgi:hypothetical protein
MDVNLSLLDGVVTAKRHPTFKIPSDEEKSLVRLGDFVRLCLVGPMGTPNVPNSEMVWVEVGAIGCNLDGTHYYGVLVSSPKIVAHLISQGEDVDFGPEHILAINNAPDETGE